MGITTKYFSNFLTELADRATREYSLYMFVSKTHDNNDELVVESANSSNYQKAIFDPSKEMVFGKKIVATDVAPVIPRYDWAANTTYQEWSSTSNTVLNQTEGGDVNPFYIYTSTGQVYKCIENNTNGESTVEPSHTDTTPREESDGYSWKYMYTVPAASKFLTTDYIPVVPNTSIVTSASTRIDKIFVNNAGNTYVEVSNGTIQSSVNTSTFIIQNKQLTYANGYAFTPADDFFNNTSILIFEPGARSNGSLFTINDYVSSTRTVSVNGAGYSSFGATTKYEITPRIRIVGDGTGATAIATINPTTKGIDSVQVKNAGSGYTFANTIVYANTGVGGEVVSVISPPQGHGFDPATELGADKIMFSVAIEENESGTINAGLQNGFRTAGIIANPAPSNTSYLGTVSVVEGQSLVTGSSTRLDDVFTVPSLDTVAGLSVATVDTIPLSNTGAANTLKANTIVNLFNEFTRNLIIQGTDLPKIVIKGGEFDDVRTVINVTSNTALNTLETSLTTENNVPFRSLYTANTFDNTKTIEVDQSGAFSNGEVVTNADFTRYGTLVNQTSNTLIIVGTEFPEGTTVIGKVSGASANVVNSTPSSTSVDPYHGQILYLNNILKVSKTNSSNVEFNIVVKV